MHKMRGRKMKVRVPSYYKDFKCIASECEDTCCAGWEVVIDDEAYNHYKNVGGKFGDRLKEEIIYEEGENIFRLKNNNCAFLNEKKMCDIYNELGEDGLCNVCKQFPRVIEDFGSLREIGLYLSCPEAARLILNNSKKIEFELSENEEEFIEDDDIDDNHFMILMECRKVVIDIIQNRNISIVERASIVMKFAEEIQEKIDWDEIEDIGDIIEKYSQKAFIEEIVKNLKEYGQDEKLKYDSSYEWINVYKNLIHINDDDPLALDNAIKCFYEDGKTRDFYIDKHKEFDKFYADKIYKFEQIIVYFIFRYFMKAIFDYDVIAKIKIAVVSYLMIKELCVVRWIENNYEFTDRDMVDIAHMYSKDIEHLEENIDTLTAIFEDTDIFTVDKIIVALMN